MQLIDSLICSVFIIGSMSSFIKRFDHIKLDCEEDKKRIKWEYTLMAVCSTFRLIIDLIFLIILPNLEISNCISPMADHL